MRDARFIAEHRGGPLGLAEHRLLALWAADCAEHVLPLFALQGDDARPSLAVSVARAWARGELSVGHARSAAAAAHAAAREVRDGAAIAAARAAAHAAATAHMADHSLSAAHYALKAAQAGNRGNLGNLGGRAIDSERGWQDDQLPAGIRALVLSRRLADDST